jgi:flagellar hook-associated protein 1 FlgK
MMTLQTALSDALSSLQAVEAQTNLISNNVANASTPGYVDRTVLLQEQVEGGVGQGVASSTVQRLADQSLATAANQASGAAAYSGEMVNVLTPYVSNVGQAADSNSLPSTISAFQQALTALSANPADSTTQSAAVTAAQNVVDQFQTLSQSVSSAREQADQGIATGVATVNSTLDALAQNEAALKNAAANGQPTAPFQDQRDSLLATLSQQVPIRVLDDGNGGIVVTTDGGTTLWDGAEHKLSFTATPSITPQMTSANPPPAGYTTGLSQVTVDGAPIAMSQSGSIAADLQLRDVTLPQFSSQLDQIAGNLISTFQTADPSVTSGQTGLFTADGAAVNMSNPTQIPGLAGEIALNASVDPSQGGQAWRMVSGAQATTQGQASDNSTVLAFLNAMNATGSYTAATGFTGSMTVGSAASAASGAQQAALSDWTDRNTTRTQQSQDATTALSNQTGVNVDEELQRLLVVQQTQSATAQVIEAVSSMMQTLVQMTLQ